MRNGVIQVLVVFALVLGVSLAASAQTTTGRLRGTVQDPDGLAMPGVTVTISGESLPGGSRIAVTGETGAYRFTALPPGLYNVLAEMDGFQTLTLADIRVGIGSTADADFVMYGEFAEAVTVTSESPLVDMASSGSSATFTAEFIKDLPTTRNFYDMMSVSPGVSLATEDSDRLVAYGSNVQSNAWFTDGIELTAPETGTNWVGVNPDMVQEIQVMGIGAPAEFGNMLGAAMNVVTKSGTNQFTGTANAYWFNNSLVDNAIDVPDQEFSGYEQVDSFWDVTATLGGPIKKDRVWFFVGFEYWRDGHAWPTQDPALLPVQYQDRYDLKLSARINDKNLLDFKGGFNDWGYPAAPNEFTSPSASAGEIGDDTVWGLNWQSVFNDRTFMEVRYSGWKSNDDNLSGTGSTEPAYIDVFSDGSPSVYTGGVWYPWMYDTSTDQASISVSHFADDFIKGDHDFKFGVQISSGTAETLLFVASPGYYYYNYIYSYDYYGTVYDYPYYYRAEQAPYFYGNEQDQWSVFVDDSWAVNDRLTINAGLRFDHLEGKIQSFPRLNLDGSPSGQSVPGIDSLFTWDNWSPRIGFAYNLGEQRLTVIRGSFGIYYDGNVGGNWNSPPPFPPTLEAYWSSSGSPTGPFDELAWTFNAGANNVDPNLKPPKTYQYSLGFERQLGTKYSVGVLGVYKDTSNQIGWEFLNDGVYEDLPYTDPFNGRQYTLLNPVDDGFPTVRKGNRPGYTAAGYLDDYWAQYWGVVLTFNRRFTDWWGMQASYTYSESTGLNPRALSQYQNNPLYGSKEGSGPNQWFNVDGAKQQGDRPNMFRVQANFELPWNMHANTAINLQDGRPYSRQNRVSELNTQASRQNYFVGDYSLRHPFQSLIDFSIGKRFVLPGNGLLKLDLQFFNLLNNTASDWFETVILGPGQDYIPIWHVKPRRLMLRVGVEF